MNFHRVWFDVTFTRLQPGTIGITRTVRRLYQEVAAMAPRTGALAYHPGGFREATGPDPTRPESVAGDRRGRRVLDAVRSAIGQLVVAAVRTVPWPVLRPVWELAAQASFGMRSRTLPPAAFAPGDVIFLADVAWSYPTWRAVRKARRQGARVVLFVHDIMPIRRPEFCFALVPKVFVLFLREMLRCCDAVICNSRATQDDLREWARREGIALPPMDFCHLGSDVPRVADARGARAQLHAFLGAAGACFAAVGTFEPKKNYPMLVKVFEGLWQRGLDVRLVIAGARTPDCAAFIEALEAHPEQGRRLLTLHDASDADIAAIYDGAHALVFPSLFEGFGLPLVEARARGCRVIASDLACFTELADADVHLYARADAQALARTLVEIAGVTQAPAPYTRALSWRDSAAQLLSRSRALLDEGHAESSAGASPEVACRP